MSTKKYKVVTRGVVPVHILDIIMNNYHDTEVTAETFANLDDDIDFLVCKCKDCHGNTNHDKSGWLTPINGDNSWDLQIEIH